VGFLERKFLGAREDTLLDEVLKNVGYLLRAKRGAAWFRPEFGITETGFRTGEEMLLVLEKEIRENLAAFEPRVEVLEVSEEYEEDSQRPRLVVKCRLKGRDELLRLTLDPRTRDVSAVPGTR
jgi:phage baseplate assembly protein W